MKKLSLQDDYKSKTIRFPSDEENIELKKILRQ